MSKNEAIALAISNPKFLARFWKKVTKTETCWLWMHGRTKGGYGAIGYSTLGMLGVHRVSWIIANGPIADGFFVCHRCDVRHCVNPQHMFVGSAADNAADMRGKGRSLRGERNSMRKLTDSAVVDIRSNYSATNRQPLASKYGVSPQQVRSIAKGKQWTHIQ